MCVCVCAQLQLQSTTTPTQRESRKICENLLLRASGKRDFHVHVLGKLFALAALAHSQSQSQSQCSVCVCVCAWLTIIQKFYKQNERPLHGRRAETETTCKQFSSAIFGFSTRRRSFRSTAVADSSLEYFCLVSDRNARH